MRRLIQLQSLKKLAQRKAKAEIAEVKARATALKNPFSKYMEALDKAPKIVDLALNLGLAYQSFKTFGISKYVTYETVQVPYEVNDWILTSSTANWLPDPNIPLPAPYWDLTPQPISPTYIVSKKTVFKTEVREVEHTAYNPAAALIGPVALKLAQADNLVSGTVGCSMLAALGVVSAAGSVEKTLYGLDPVRALQDAWKVISGG